MSLLALGELSLTLFEALITFRSPTAVFVCRSDSADEAGNQHSISGFWPQAKDTSNNNKKKRNLHTDTHAGLCSVAAKKSQC